MRLTKDSVSDSSSIPQPDRQSALLLVDPQNDFFPGGAMGMSEGKNLIALINAYIKHFSRQGFSILATRDWHPPNHCSFTEQGGPHPTHCVQGSRGAQFHSELVMPPGMMVISKGTDAKKDSKSGFEGSSLADRLEDLDVKTVFVLGPAIEVAVKNTVIEACRLGLQVIVLTDTIGDGQHQQSTAKQALDEMNNARAFFAVASDLALPAP